MPILGPGDTLPARPRRLLVAGTSGAGKTTVAWRAAAALGCPHVELDALHHGPDWSVRPQFEADVAAFSAQPAWTTEWQYSRVRGLLLDRAELLVWLDLPRRVVMRRVIARTLRRRLGRQRLWNGNVEPPLRTILTDSDHIVRWAWRTHARTHRRVLMVASTRPDLPVVRLRTPAEITAWLAGPLAEAARR